MKAEHKVIVLIPALNEEEKIGEVIQAIPEFVDQVVVVNDGSTDNTAAVARKQGANVVSHMRNKGVGAAFQTGVQHALQSPFDILVNMDADGQFNPADIEHLIQPILNKEAHFVTASRFKDKALVPVMPKIKYRGNQFMAWFISKITKQRFYDVSCGFRAYTRDTLLHLNLFGDFTYTQESFIDLVFKGQTIQEVPTKVRGTREFGKSRVASNLFRYGYQTLSIILRIYRDYKPFRLFGLMGLFSLLAGIGLGGFVFWHYLSTGFFTPYKWLAFAAGFFSLLGLLLLLLGFIMDTFSRMRHNQEEILYHLKKQDRCS